MAPRASPVGAAEVAEVEGVEKSIESRVGDLCFRLNLLVHPYFLSITPHYGGSQS